MVLGAGNSMEATNTGAYTGLICKITQEGSSGVAWIGRACPVEDLLLEDGAQRWKQHGSHKHCGIDRADLQNHTSGVIRSSLDRTW